MIKFFRHIRKKLVGENRFSKYLIYAIGEIVLVVIGILIALQINNWNESRKAKVRSIEYHTRLIEDVERVVATSEKLNQTSYRVLNSIQRTVDLLDLGKPLTSKDKEIVDYTLVWVSRFNYQFTELATYEEMQSNGDLSLIYNINLRDKLVNFHDYMASVDAIFNRLGTTITNDLSMLDKYVKSKVNPETLEITNKYNFLDMAKDKKFINEFSRIAVHWRGNAFFTNQIKNRAQNLKKTIQSDLKKIQ
jgi:hypothetical protein